MNIAKIAEDIDFTSSSIKYYSDHYYLTNYEVEVLDRYNIDYKKCSSLKEILFYIEDFMNNDDFDDDLGNVSLSISERDYYQNSNK